MKTALATLALTLAAATAAVPAHAHGITVRVDTPEIGIRFGAPPPHVYAPVHGPIYGPPPVIVAPRPPVAYYPAPFYAPPPRVVVVPPPVYVPHGYGRPPRYVDPYGRVIYVKPYKHHKHWRHGRHDRDDD